MVRKIAIVLFCLAALTTPSAGVPSGPDTGPIPPGEAGAKEAVERSPRHHEWADIVVPGKETNMARLPTWTPWGRSARPCSGSTARTTPG